MQKLIMITFKVTDYCTTEYTVEIPNNIEFSSFLTENLITKPSAENFGVWMTGFKSQIHKSGELRQLWPLVIYYGIDYTI